YHQDKQAPIAYKYQETFSTIATASMSTRNAPPPIVTAPLARPKAPGYKNQLKRYLENKYRSISCLAINQVMKHVDFNCRDADRLLHRIESTRKDVLDINDIVETLAKVRVAFPAMQEIQKVFLKSNRPKKSFRVTDPTLRRDIEAADVIDLTNDDKENDVPPARLKDEMVECGCCYGDYAASDMKECTANAGHKVCKDCIYRYVSEQLDGNNCTEFKCIISQECGQPYHHVNVLEEVLSPRLKKRTNDAILLAAAKEAGCDVWTCKKCNSFGVLEDDTIKIVYCQQCNTNYCRMCHRVAHMRKTCEEIQAEEDRAKDPVNKAHEAMSKAVTRHCPKCLTPFVKHDGCNKMTCNVVGCGKKSCYLCGVEVQDYEHFCNHKLRGKNIPCPCGKPCRLFTSTEEMIERDRKARQEAGRKVLEADGLNEERIRDILQSPDAKKKAESEKKPAARAQDQPAGDPGVAADAVERMRQGGVLRNQRRAERLNAPPRPAAAARVFIANENHGEALRNERDQVLAAVQQDQNEMRRGEAERLHRRLAERRAQMEQRLHERRAEMEQRQAERRAEMEQRRAARPQCILM
ncbi:MAG: hypothetical protein SGILL_006675, partial [Bacillariaceae sp.]